MKAWGGIGKVIKEKEQRGQQAETGMAIGICRVR